MANTRIRNLWKVIGWSVSQNLYSDLWSLKYWFWEVDHIKNFQHPLNLMCMADKKHPLNFPSIKLHVCIFHINFIEWFFFILSERKSSQQVVFFFNKLVWHKIYCIWILLFISKELHLYSPFHLIAYHIVFLLGRPLKYVLITSIYTFGTFSQNRRIYIWTIVFIFIVAITMFWPSVFIRYTWITYKVFWNEPFI